jgi:predicted metalloprotease with PDZ domain
LIRERSQGARSLDDFAKAFFGINDGSYSTVTHSFADVVQALNKIEPYDWAGFLHERVEGIITFPWARSTAHCSNRATIPASVLGRARQTITR